MKSVRKCFLAMLSTVSIAVAASGAQAQSLPTNPGPNSRASEFAVDGNLPFDPLGQATQGTPADGRPPVVRATRNSPPNPSATAPQNVGQSQFSAGAPTAGGQRSTPVTGPQMAAAPTMAAGSANQDQMPNSSAQTAANSRPLAYMPAAGALPQPAYGYAPPGYGVAPAAYGAAPMGYGVAPAAYPPPQGGFGQPPVGYDQLPYQMAQMPDYANPGMGYPNPGMAYGNPGMGYPQEPPQPNGWATPAGYGAPQALPPGAGGIAGPAGEPGGQSFCGQCGGQGCANCGFGRGFGNGGGFMAGLLGHLLPYAEGGQCAPRWYDITLDAMYLKREKISRRVDFTADGPGPDPNIIMSTDDLDFDKQVGFRLNGAVQVLSTATAEFTYFGLFNWSSSDSRSDPTGGLFSPISGFATAPPGGFPQTDDAIFHSIAYSSGMDNFELNFRRRWSAPNCRVQASFLMGVRYFYLLEDFRYFTQGKDTLTAAIPPVLVPAGQMDYQIRARNSLTGFQMGGDLWSSIVPGVKVGGELKAGAYGNYANQSTTITVTEPDFTYPEKVHRNDVAFIADANLMAIWRVNPNWTIRAGYYMLYVDGVLLAPEQFNSTLPNLVFPPTLVRVPGANDNGSAFYHGGFAGLEWQW